MELGRVSDGDCEVLHDDLGRVYGPAAFVDDYFGVGVWTEGDGVSFRRDVAGQGELISS